MDAGLMLDRTHGGSEQPTWIKGTADKGIFGLIKARDRERLPVWSPFDAPSVDVLSRSRRRSNKQLLLAARLMSVAARALRARAALCWKAPQQNCGRYPARDALRLTDAASSR